MRESRGLARKWVVLIVAGGLSLIALVAVVYFYTGIGPYDLPQNSRELDSTIAKSKELGLPMTKEELMGPPPPADQNAAPGVLEIVDSLIFPDSLVAHARLGADPHLLSEQAQWLKTHGKSLDKLVATLASRKSWHVDRDYDLGPYTLLPEYAYLRRLAQLLTARSVQSAVKGEWEGALTDLAAARDLGHRVATEPTLISLLVSMSIDVLSLKGVPFIADQWQQDPGRLAALEGTIVGSNQRLSVVPALRGEFYMSLCTTRNLRAFGGMEGLSMSGSESGGPKVDLSRIVRTGLPQGLFERASLNLMARNWNTVFEGFKSKPEPYRDWTAPLTAWEKRAESRFRASEILALILAPVYAQTDGSLTASDVNQDLAVAFVRCMQYRAEHGKWPSSLKEVGADFPDPFTSGKSIQAKFAADELWVWSIGRDRKDDGGRPRDATHKEVDDLAFRWPPSPKS